MGCQDLKHTMVYAMDPFLGGIRSILFGCSLADQAARLAAGSAVKIKSRPTWFHCRYFTRGLTTSVLLDDGA